MVIQNYFDLNFDANALVLSGDDNRVGIDDTNPRFALDMGTTEGRKLTLWDNGTFFHGFGIDTDRTNFFAAKPVGAAPDMTLLGFNNHTPANLGINTVNPSERLDVVGNIRATGTVSAGGVVLTSDARLKKNIRNIDGAINKVMALRPVSYLKKENLKSTEYNLEEYGFIAQELKKVLPKLIQESRDEEKLLQIQYLSLIPILTKAMQKQQEQIKAQNAENKELKEELTRIKQMILELKK